MTADTITVAYLVHLAQQLSIAERTQLRGALLELDQELLARQQRQHNQSALDALDRIFFQPIVDQAQDDSWWAAFAESMNTQRMAYRPLYPDPERTEDAADCP